MGFFIPSAAQLHYYRYLMLVTVLRMLASPFNEWHGLSHMTKLQGLKKVVVGNKYYEDLGFREPIDQALMTTEIRGYLQDAGVEIVFED